MLKTKANMEKIPSKTRYIGKPDLEPGTEITEILCKTDITRNKNKKKESIHEREITRESMKEIPSERDKKTIPKRNKYSKICGDSLDSKIKTDGSRV